MKSILIINCLLAISTTIGMTITPFIITDALGCSLMVLGIIEGCTELFSNILKFYGGFLFDRVKNKNRLFIGSVGSALIAKAILFLPSAWAVVLSKSIERMSNGAFASPRDAYIAESSRHKGTIMSLLNVSKAIGCVVGPILVSCFALFVGDIIKNVNLLIGVCVFVVCIAFYLSLKLRVKNYTEASVPKISSLLKEFKNIKPILILSFLFFLGRFNDGVLMIHLKQQGFPEWFYLSTIGIFNSIMIVSSPYIGSTFDRDKFKAITIVLISMIAFQASFLCLEGVNWILGILGLLLWGIQRGGSQVVLSSMIFSKISKESYGSAIGLYYIVSGIGSLIASFVCGYIALNCVRDVFFFGLLCSVIAFNYYLFFLDRKEDKAII